MHRLVRFVLGVLSTCWLIAVSAHAGCSVSLTAPAEAQSGQTYSVLINPAGPAYRYVSTEEWSGRLGFNQFPHSTVSEQPAVSNTEPFNIHPSISHRTTFDLPVSYRVTAINSSNPSDSCVGEATVLVHADPELARETRRTVIPVVGTTAGLNGSFFKTSLSLAGNETLHGRLVFHPIGRPGSDSDPSIPYDFSKGNLLVFDDLMAAFGLFGVGSLDIVPEGDSLQSPDAQARIYNTSAQGTFGTMEPIFFPADWFGLNRPAEESHAGASIAVLRIPDGMRVNLGIRSFSQLSFTISISHADGTSSFKGPLGMDPDTLLMGTPSQLVAPLTLPDLVPGDTVSILISRGAGIPFYTLTDNKTNDPAINFPVLGGGNLSRYDD